MAGDALLGREMGRYRVESIIGSGGFATVYRAIDLALERPVALKVVDPTAHRNPTIGRRFVLEGRAVASLDHPAIVPVFDAGENDGVLWMAMRLIPGGSLDDALVAGRRFTFEQVAAVITRIGDALDHAHGHGVVHRDVKPSNILLEHNDPGRAWLADFGIAATTRTAGRYTTGALGTAAYMAPEQARPSSVGPPADLYSLGCVAYELLTRRRPFPGDDYVELLVAHATHPVPPTPWPRVDEFMQRALAKDPTARPPSGQAFAEDLHRTLQATPRPTASAAPLPPPPPPAPSPAAGPASPAASPPAPAAAPNASASPAPPPPAPPAPPPGAASPGAAIAASPAPPPSSAATDTTGPPSPPGGTGATPARGAAAAVPSGEASATAKPGDDADKEPDGPPRRPPEPPPHRLGNPAHRAALAAKSPGQHTDGPPGRPAAPPPHRPGDPLGRPAGDQGAGDETTQPAAPPTGAAAADQAPASPPARPAAPVAGAATDRAAVNRPNQPVDETTQPAAPPTGSAAANHPMAGPPNQPAPQAAGTDHRAVNRPSQPAAPPAGRPAGDGRPAPPVPAPTVVEQVDKTLEHPSLRLPPPPVHPPSGWGGAGQRPPSTPPGGLRPPSPRDPTVVRTGRRRGRQRLVAGGAVIAVGIVAAIVALLDRPKEGSRRVDDRAGITYDRPRGWTSDTSQAPLVVFEENGSQVATFTRAPTDDSSAADQLADADPDVCAGDPEAATIDIRGAEQLAQCVNDSTELPSVAIGAVAQGQFWVITVFSTASDADREEFLGNIELSALDTAP